MQQENLLGGNSGLVVGGVYRLKFNDLVIRVLCFDNLEVLYEVFSPEQDKDKHLKKRLFYYRLPTPFFIENNEYIKTVDLTDLEYDVYRPDIPLRLLRFVDEKVVDIDKIEGTVKSGNIFLAPVTKTNRFGKSILLTDESKKEFILYSNLFKSALEIKDYPKGKGVGLHRLGSEKGIPLYYVGGYMDLAGHLS